MTTSLDAALIAAHEAGDKDALVALYEKAADAATEDDARAFFLTQAYVFALEVGSPRAGALNRRLAAMGRDTAQPDLS